MAVENSKPKIIKLSQDFGSADMKEYLLQNKQGLIYCSEFPGIMFRYNRADESVWLEKKERQDITNLFSKHPDYDLILNTMKALIQEVNGLDMDLTQKKNSV